MTTFKFQSVFLVLVLLLLGTPLVSLAGGGDGGSDGTDAASSLGFAANDGFYGNNTQGTVGTSDAEAGLGSSNGGSFGMSFSGVYSMNVPITTVYTKTKEDIPENYTVHPPDEAYGISKVTDENGKHVGYYNSNNDVYSPIGEPIGNTTMTEPTDSRFGYPDSSRFGYGEEMGPSAADNPGGFGNGNTGGGNTGGGNTGGGNTGGGNTGGGNTGGGNTGGGNTGGGNTGGGNTGGGNTGGGNTGGGNTGGGNTGGGNTGGGNTGGGNTGGGPGHGADGTSNPDDSWWRTVQNLAQGIQTAVTAVNPGIGVLGNATLMGTNAFFSNPTVVRNNTPRYTNLGNLPYINSSSTIRLIAKADRTDEWQIEDSTEADLASSTVRLITTTNEMDDWYSGKSYEANSIILEAKVVDSEGRTIVNWVAIPFGLLNIPQGAHLYLRWNADSYTQCLAYLNDYGRYSLQTQDRSMKRGDTERERYDIPEVTGIYSIQCAKQIRNGTIVDQKKIEVIVGKVQ